MHTPFVVLTFACATACTVRTDASPNTRASSEFHGQPKEDATRAPNISAEPEPASWPTLPDDAHFEHAFANDGKHTAVFFALPGRELSDRMQQRSLHAPAVLQQLATANYRTATLDGFANANRYTAWIGGGEGMGIAILDPQGRCYAARPGPQDPAELTAFLETAARQRSAIHDSRAALAARPNDPALQHQLALVMLELGCRVEAKTLLLSAADAGVQDARHRLARLHALDGALVEAREWLRGAPNTPAAEVTIGYVLFKQRRHRESATALASVLATAGPELGDDRQRALLYLGKALTLDGQEREAVRILTKLMAEQTGSTFEAAAAHTLDHIRNPSDHGHTH